MVEIYSIPASLAELDRRATDYRYDLEADIRWSEVDAPGALVPPSVLASLGADVAGIQASGQAAGTTARPSITWSASSGVSARRSCPAFGRASGRFSTSTRR